MRAVVQTVTCASVDVNGQIVADIEAGLLVYLGIQADDGEDDLAYIADKISTLRIFADDAGKMNLNVRQGGGEILVVPAFTLLGDARKGRRPSFDQAAEPRQAEALYLALVRQLTEMQNRVQTGRFRRTMNVTATNAGPVLALLDSRKQF